jgi:hypothetical protein
MDDNSVRQITTRSGPKILAGFKSALPDWHEIPWDNSVLELTPTLVFVYHTWNDVLVRTAILDRNEGDWPAEVRRNLEQNSIGPPAIK